MIAAVYFYKQLKLSASEKVETCTYMGKDFTAIQKILQNGKKKPAIAKNESMPKLIQKRRHRNHINLMKKNDAKPCQQAIYPVGQDKSPRDYRKLMKKETFNCPICLSLVVQPVITICGHLYCCKCIEDIFSQNNRCTYCDTIINPNFIRKSMISDQIICQAYLSTLSIHDKDQSNNQIKANHLWKHVELKDLKVCGLIDFYENALEEWRSGIIIRIKHEWQDNFSVVMLDIQSLKLVEKTFHPFNFADCLLKITKIRNCLDPFAFLAADTQDRLLTSKLQKYWQSIEEFKKKRYQLSGPSLYGLYLAIDLKRKQLIAEIDLYRFFIPGEPDSAMQNEDKTQVSFQELRKTSSYKLMQRLEQLQDEKLKNMREETNQKADLQMLQDQMLGLSLKEDKKKTVQADVESMKDQSKQANIPSTKSTPRLDMQINYLIDSFLYEDSSILLSQLIYL